MHDQANDLRALMIKAARQQAAQNGPAPQMIAVSGGKGGVGATTIALHLATALGHQALRVVLVDANPYRADVASLCRLGDSANIADLLNGTRDIHEVLQRGPAGIQIVPGAWAPEKPADFSSQHLRRLLGQLSALGRHADMVLIDVGAGATEAMRGFWQATSEVILVTTPDQVAVMDAYATIKTLLPQQSAPAVKLVVNRADETQAKDVYRRIDQSCRRFLQLQVELLGRVPEVPTASRAPVELPAELLEAVANRIPTSRAAAGATTTAVA